MARRGMKVWGTCNHTFREQPQRDLRTLRHLRTTISTFIVNNIRNSCEVLLNPTVQSRNVFSYAGYRQYFAQLAALRDKWFFIIVFSSWAAAVLWQSPRFLVPLLTKKSSQGEREVAIDKCWNWNSMKDFFTKYNFPPLSFSFWSLTVKKRTKLQFKYVNSEWKCILCSASLFKVKWTLAFHPISTTKDASEWPRWWFTKE